MSWGPSTTGEYSSSFSSSGSYWDIDIWFSSSFLSFIVANFLNFFHTFAFPCQFCLYCVVVFRYWGCICWLYWLAGRVFDNGIPISFRYFYVYYGIWQSSSAIVARLLSTCSVVSCSWSSLFPLLLPHPKPTTCRPAAAWPGPGRPWVIPLSQV